jgi:hypothetical protein
MYPQNPFHVDPPESYRKETEPEQVEAEPDDIDILITDKVARHRAERLAAAGLNTFQARALALDRRVDIHFVIDRLIGRGCPPDIAFDIAS